MSNKSEMNKIFERILGGDNSSDKKIQLLLEIVKSQQTALCFVLAGFTADVPGPLFKGIYDHMLEVVSQQPNIPDPVVEVITKVIGVAMDSVKSKDGPRVERATGLDDCVLIDAPRLANVIAGLLIATRYREEVNVAGIDVIPELLDDAVSIAESLALSKIDFSERVETAIRVNTKHLLLQTRKERKERFNGNS